MQPDTSRGTNRIRTAVVLALVLGLPLFHLANLGKLYGGLGTRWSGEAAWLTFVTLILAYVLVVERRPLSSLGFRRPTAFGLSLGVLAAIVIIAGDAAISVVEAVLHLTVKPQIAALFTTPLWFRVWLTTRAAIAEEIAFRGFGFERLAELAGSRYVAAAATFALFALAHYTGGGLALFLVAAWGGLVLTLLYLWRRNLWVTITAHWLTDAVGFLIMPLLRAHH